MDVSPVVERNKAFLELFANAKGTQLRYLAESATRDQLKAVCEVALNYTHGILVSTISFARNTRFLKALANAETPLDLKKRLISESTIYRNIVKRLLSSVSNQL